MAPFIPIPSKLLRSLVCSLPFIMATSGLGTGCARIVELVPGQDLKGAEPELVELLEIEEYAETARNLKFAEASDSAVTQVSYDVPPAPEPISGIPDSDVWHMTLQEAISIALERNQIIPVESEFLGAGNLLFNPEAAPSYFDPAIRRADIRGIRGTDAAESDFIPRVSTQYNYGQDENIQNNLFTGGLAPGEVLKETTGNYSLQWEKLTTRGGNLSLRQDINFDRNNVDARLFPSAYDSQFSLDFVQPLWQGAGREFTEIAGPRSLISQRSPSMDQGIVIACLNEQISEQEFRQVLQRLVRDVTNLYWELFFAHQRLGIESQTHDNALEVWKKTQAKLNQGIGGGAADEAQAHENYLAVKARMQDAEAEVALTENRFRRLLHLPRHDQQLIKPFDPPETDRPGEEWMTVLATAFGNRLELQSTKLSLRSLELQLIAARKYARPSVDFVSNLHTNGFGDRLFRDTDQSTLVRDSAFNNQFDFDETGWSAGVVLSFPVNPQLQRTLVRQLELRLAKLRAALNAQEFEITRELTHAMKTVERWQRLVQTNQERVEAAQKQVNALVAAFPAGRTSIDLLVRAQTTLSLAATEYARSLTEYNKALAELEYRQGILLEARMIRLRH